MVCRLVTYVILFAITHKSTDKARAGSVINVSVNAVVLLATMLEPYMPELVDRSVQWLHPIGVSLTRAAEFSSS